MASRSDEFIPTRKTLLKRLKDVEDQESWREFFDTYWRLIYSVALKAGLSETEAQDVVQDTVVTVARQMPKFDYDPARGSFKGWLLQITRSRVADQWRKRPPGSPALFPTPDPGSTGTPLIERMPDPASVNLDEVWEHEWEQSLVDAAIERVRAQADAVQYQLFYLHVLRQWPATKVARKFRVNLGQVYYAKYKITSQIKKEVRRLEKKMG